MSKILDPQDPLGQALQIGPHTFPGIWRYMMPPELLSLRFPAERRSSCMNCPKACWENYRSDYRCCTYHPRIPNFLLGLAYDKGQAVDAVGRLVELGMASPEGLNGPPQQWIEYLRDVENDTFGKSERILCPMLDQSNGLCQVHAFRNSVCSTFFCLKDHGGVGDEFWLKLQTLGSQLEMALAQWALEQVGFDVKAYIQRLNKLAPKMKKLADPKTGGWSKESHSYLWGEFAGREVELYLATGAVISTHRHELWEIAHHQEILEAERFDQAMVRMVPKELKGQVDEEDHQPGGETIPARDLWRRCFQSYQRLWQVPYGPYRLASRVRIRENKQKTAEEQYYKSKPYCVEYLSAPRSKETDWQLFVTELEKNILEMFSNTQTLDWKFMSRAELSDHPEGRGFVSEMIASRVLIKQR